MTIRESNSFTTRARRWRSAASDRSRSGFVPRRGEEETGRRGDSHFPTPDLRLTTYAPQPSTLNPQPSTRRGFTLIELMVVITIIAFLMGMLTFAGYSFVVSAKESATRATITKVDEAILERVSAINRWHERALGQRGYDLLVQDWDNRGWLQGWTGIVKPGTPPIPIVPPNLVPAPDDKPSLLALSRKQSMKEMFPITWGELNECYWFWGIFEADGAAGFNGNPMEIAKRNKFLEDNGLKDPASADIWLDRPGEIFLYALKNAPVFGGLPMVADDFRESELGDPDEDGVPELIDAWGTPLRFYRWPTRVVNNGEPGGADWNDGSPPHVAQTVLMPNAPVSPPSTPPNEDSLKRDPDDPARYLLLLQVQASGVPVTTYFHDPFTWHAPLVVSAGADEQLGLAEPNVSIDVPTTTIPRYGLAEPLSEQTTVPAEIEKYNEQLFDNLTNHNSDGGL